MIRCSICELIIDGDQEWFVLTVITDGEPTTGFLCSMDHLTDYVAKTYAMAADPEHPGWLVGG